MPQKIIGIDVGTYSVKVAEVERSFKSFSFLNFYERRIQYNELLSPEESVAIALQGIMDDNDISWEVACAGVPGQRVSSRLLTFPFGSIKKISQTVTFEMESHIPFDIEEVLLDYSVVWSTKEASKVLVAYMRKSEFAKELSTLQGLGIDPRYYGVEGMELVHLVTLGMVPPEGAYAIIDLGHEKTTVAICQGKNLSYVRAISIAGKMITERIAKALEVPYDEAERIKIEMGQVTGGQSEAVDDMSSKVNKAINDVLSDLFLNLRQTLFTFSDTEGVPVEGIFICGGTSRMPGLDRALTDALKQNVAHLNALDFHFCRLSHGEANRHVIPQALALALRGVAAGGQHDINFRQGEFAFTGDVEQLGGSMRRVIIVIGLIVALALGHFTIKYYSLKKRLGKLQDDVASLVTQALPGTPKRSLKTTQSALSVIKSKEKEVQDRVASLEGILGLSPLDVLTEISKTLPSREEIKVDVNNLSIKQGRATFSGSTDSFESVDRIKMALEKSPLFRNVTTGNVRKGVKGEIKFDVAMEVGPEEAK
jgi:type IV pilus assembly protein PilM